jgi:SWI/SNF-related matrix-associated actin-dependent regulator of chromatin subfamily A3
MTSSNRTAAIKKMNSDPDCTVMIASLSCGSVGLNLVFANHVILMDIWWSPAVGMSFFFVF